MNVVKEIVSDTKMHEQSNKESKLASKKDLIEGMLAKVNAIKHNQRPVDKSTYHTD